MVKNNYNLLGDKILKMAYVRTPKEIWNNLSSEFNFTVDACASDKNYLIKKYWTKENSALDKNWDGEIIYCHPMYDIHIPKFIKKAVESKCLTVFLLPASTNAKYFHDFLWDNKKHRPQKDVEIRFLPVPNVKKGKTHGYKFLTDDFTAPKSGYLRPLMVVIIDKRY